MSIQRICDVCGAVDGWVFMSFTRVTIESDDPQYEDTRMDVCRKCKRKLKKHIDTIRKGNK